jgi:hypothetical protein
MKDKFQFLVFPCVAAHTADTLDRMPDGMLTCTLYWTGRTKRIGSRKEITEKQKKRKLERKKETKEEKINHEKKERKGNEKVNE